MSLDTTITSTARRLVQQTGMPHARALMKSEGTAVGWVLLIPGLILCVGTGVFLVLALLLRVPVAIPLVLAASIVALLALFLVGFGFSLIARETSPWIAAVGAWLVGMVRAWRGKNGG